MSAPMTELRLCKHCKWFRPKWFEQPRFAKCGHIKGVRFSGEQFVNASVPDRRYCATMRESPELCGPLGFLWEPHK
jgi:hypothetical protein